MSSVKVFKSKTFTTDPVRAVFPHLKDPDRFGSFSIDVDVLNNPTLQATLEEQAAATLTAALSDIGTDSQPTNSFVRDGEYKDEPYRRASFKMKATRRVKGAEIAQSPAIVDAQKQPVTEDIFGGSLVKIAYYFQYTLMATGTYLSLKLKAVQIIEHVGPGGESSGVDAFDCEDGFTSSGEEDNGAPAPGADSANGDDSIKNGSDF
jgi:hypothetical protein